MSVVKGCVELSGLRSSVTAGMGSEEEELKHLRLLAE